MLPNTVHQGQADHGSEEQQEDADVGDAGVQVLEKLVVGCDAEDSLQDEDVGKADKEQV